MFSFNTAGAERPRYNVLRALQCAVLLSSASIAAVAAPVISGAPASTITAAHYYSFVPGASDSVAGKTLTFSIGNKPSWAQFDAQTGHLYGTPLPQSNVGTFANISISVSDGTSTASLAPFSVVVAPLPNIPPVVAGTAAATATAGKAYSFQPTASDPNGLRLTFVIANMPAWASFNSATGALTGTPTAANVGTWSNITITAYDGYSKAALPAFAIVVQPATASVPPPAPGSATLAWSPPTETTGGAVLANLAGYHIYYGTTPNLGNEITISNPGLTRYAFSGLSAATWYFEMTAYDTAGTESPPTALESIVTQ
jgi:hypothetical protein